MQKRRENRGAESWGAEEEWRREREGKKRGDFLTEAEAEAVAVAVIVARAVETVGRK